MCRTRTRQRISYAACRRKSAAWGINQGLRLGACARWRLAASTIMLGDASIVVARAGRKKMSMSAQSPPTSAAGPEDGSNMTYIRHDESATGLWDAVQYGTTWAGPREMSRKQWQISREMQ